MNQKFPITHHTFKWLENLLSERFGHSWKIKRTVEGLSLHLPNAGGKILFDKLYEGFEWADSDKPCTFWQSERDGLNSIIKLPLPCFGISNLPSPLIEWQGRDQIIHYDILGLIYWMLARVEEIECKSFDLHERIPSESSLAFKHRCLDRPFVDEWLDMLGQIIKRQWIGIELKKNQFRLCLSHDVDEPSLYAFKSWSWIARVMVAHLVKRKDLKAFFQAPFVKLITQKELVHDDPYNTFDWLMEVSESNNIKSVFYFISGKNDTIYDADYEIEHPVIRKLIRQIYERGHEIGLHPSYNSYKNNKILKDEAEKLKRVCAEEGVIQDKWGARMHYLQWKQPDTLFSLMEAGIDYDATLGYADSPGFRCGTCYEYPAFDAQNQIELPFRIQPLIVMESSIIGDSYVALGVNEDALNYMQLFKDRCQAVSGQFRLLWHNSSLFSEETRLMYKMVVQL